MIKTRFDRIYKRFDYMNKLFNGINKRFGYMLADMNKRFEEHFNFNMKKFKVRDLQIFNILEEIRDIIRVFQKKVDLDEFRRPENNYLKRNNLHENEVVIIVNIE